MRLRALPMADGTVRPVLEANVVNVGRRVRAGLHLLSSTGSRARSSPGTTRSENFAYNDVFQGSVDPATGCGTRHPFDLTDDLTRQINAVATGVPADDFVLKLYTRLDAAHLAGPRHQPRGPRLQRRIDPEGHLLRAGLRVRARLGRRRAVRPHGEHERQRRAQHRRRSPATRSGATSPPTPRSTPPPRSRATRSSGAGTRTPDAPRRPPRCATLPPSAPGTPSARCPPSRRSATTPTPTRRGAAR